MNSSARSSGALHLAHQFGVSHGSLTAADVYVGKPKAGQSQEPVLLHGLSVQEANARRRSHPCGAPAAR